MDMTDPPNRLRKCLDCSALILLVRPWGWLCRECKEKLQALFAHSNELMARHDWRARLVVALTHRERKGPDV